MPLADIHDVFGPPLTDEDDNCTDVAQVTTDNHIIRLSCGGTHHPQSRQHVRRLTDRKGRVVTVRWPSHCK